MKMCTIWTISLRMTDILQSAGQSYEMDQTITGLPGRDGIKIQPAWDWRQHFLQHFGSSSSEGKLTPMPWGLLHKKSIAISNSHATHLPN